MRKGGFLLIEFKNIVKKYKNKEVLADLSFQINTGDFVAIIGASGCGKTTTLKMINRLIEPTAGKVFIDGEDIGEKDVIKLRRNMGYVIQQTGLFPHMTVKDNIEIIPKATHMTPEDIKARTCELMEMVGLNCDEFLNRYPTELSGGQQQRVGVARAFATNPDIILMDEPLSALDPITRAGLQDELIDLQSKFRKTIVFVTHDMDEAIKIADKICIMDKGHIIQYDTPENILKYPANEFVLQFVGSKRIWTSPQFIKARDILLENAVSTTANSSLFGCLEKMRSTQVDSLLVVDAKTKRMEGVIYAEQILREKDLSLKAKEVMKKDFVSIGPEDNILEVLRIVQQNKMSSIPVVDENGRLSGIITKSSLITTLSQQYITEEEA